MTVNNSPAASWQHRFGTGSLLALQRLVSRMPFTLQMHLGALAGGVVYLLASRRRRIAARNIELCFPQLDESERKSLLRRHFSSLGKGLFEIGLAWYADAKRLRHRLDVQGIEHVAQAQAQGRGVILAGGHFTTMDMTCRLLGLVLDYDVTYRPLGNAEVDAAIQSGRQQGSGTAIPKRNIRRMLKSLKAGRAVWLAVDQADTSEHPVNAQFFGIAAPTSNSAARIAESSGAAVLPFFSMRRPDGTYLLRIDPALNGFPSGDELRDANRLNAIVEAQARLVPEQYYWIHRRFKNDPATYA